MTQTCTIIVCCYPAVSLLTALIGKALGIGYGHSLAVCILLTPLVGLYIFISTAIHQVYLSDLLTEMRSEAEHREESIDEEISRLDYFLDKGVINKRDYDYLKRVIHKNQSNG